MKETTWKEGKSIAYHEEKGKTKQNDRGGFDIYANNLEQERLYANDCVYKVPEDVLKGKEEWLQRPAVETLHDVLSVTNLLDHFS